MAQRRHINAVDRRMDAQTEEKSKATVLLGERDLSTAADAVTKGGKKNINGLYLPSAKKVQTSAEYQRAGKAGIGNADAQRDLNLAKVARTYKVKEHHRHQEAEKYQKSAEQFEDEAAERRAKRTLDGIDVHEKMLYEDLFNFFDVDKDRTWGSIEFAQRMTDIGCDTSVEAASNLLYFAGVRDVDRITYNDFIALMPKLKAFRKLLEKDAMRAFQERDTSCTGYLSCKQLREVIVKLAGPDGMYEEQVALLVRRADRERTGRIPFSFFIRALFGTPPIVEYQLPKRGSLFSLFGCGRARPRQDSDSDEDDTKT